jgi:hypothetical protein
VPAREEEKGEFYRCVRRLHCGLTRTEEGGDRGQQRAWRRGQRGKGQPDMMATRRVACSSFELPWSPPGLAARGLGQHSASGEGARDPGRRTTWMPRVGGARGATRARVRRATSRRGARSARVDSMCPCLNTYFFKIFNRSAQGGE